MNRNRVGSGIFGRVKETKSLNPSPTQDRREGLTLLEFILVRTDKLKQYMLQTKSSWWNVRFIV